MILQTLSSTDLFVSYYVYSVSAVATRAQFSEVDLIDLTIRVPQLLSQLTQFNS